MSFCSIGNRNNGHIASESYLRQTAQGLKSTLQCWIANALGHGWCPHDIFYDRAQCGGLFYPIGQISVNPECKFIIENRNLSSKFNSRSDLAVNPRPTRADWTVNQPWFLSVGQNRSICRYNGTRGRQS